MKEEKKTTPCNLLIESEEAGLTESQFDGDNLVLRNVCLLGPTSRNGRRYPHEVIQESLAMFQGCKAYLNHPAVNEARSNRCRDIRDLIGKYENPRIEEGKLRADLKVLPHYMEMIRALATHMPDSVGLSINARGRTSMREGEEIIERILDVRSVDLVTDPAATNGLFESDDSDPSPDWKGLNLDDLKEHRPDLIEELEEPLLEQIRALREENRARKASPELREKFFPKRENGPSDEEMYGRKL